MSNFKLEIGNWKLEIPASGRAGFTLPELLITMGIIAILFGFVSINLIRLQRSSYLTTTVDTLVSDLYSQQNKAMIGDTEGQTSNDVYGIHFNQNDYVLFRGAYSVSEPSNFVINLNSIEFDASSRSEIIFERGSGEVYQFSIGPNQVILRDTTNGETKTIIFNKYGVITGIN